MNIMKKISLALALCCASFYSMADQLSLGGFSYGPMEAPTGKEWESPENLALNKEQPHAYIFPFQDVGHQPFIAHSAGRPPCSRIEH